MVAKHPRLHENHGQNDEIEAWKHNAERAVAQSAIVTNTPN